MKEREKGGGGEKKEGRRKEKKRRKEKRKEKERLGKRKEMGERKRRERERGGASAPVAAATVAGRPRARGIRALREEKGIAPALIAAGDRARAAGLRAARDRTAIRFSVGQKGLGLGFRRRVVFKRNTLARVLIW
jgi:hypothetical protein